MAILCRPTLDGADIDPTSMEVEKEKPRNRMSNTYFTSLDKFRSCHDRMNLHLEASRDPKRTRQRTTAQDEASFTLGPLCL